MGWRVYGEPEEKRSWLGQFIENLVCGFMAFTTCIGGWLVHFGMGAWWMLGISAIIAVIFALNMARKT